MHGFAFRLKSCQIRAVHDSWERAVRRFAILRTSFHFAPVAGRWAQVIHTDADLKWSTKQYHGSPNLAKDLVKSLSFQEPADFSRSPLYLRHAVLNGEDYVVVVLHHALYDGISLPKLFSFVGRDLMGEDPSAPPVQLQDVIDDILVQERVGVEYWTQSLKGFGPSRFSRDQFMTARTWRSSLRLALNRAIIDRTCRRYHVSSQCIMQLAWAKVLANSYQRADVVFGQVLSGRALPGAADIVAPLFVSVK